MSIRQTMPACLLCDASWLAVSQGAAQSSWSLGPRCGTGCVGEPVQRAGHAEHAQGEQQLNCRMRHGRNLKPVSTSHTLSSVNHT